MLKYQKEAVFDKTCRETQSALIKDPFVLTHLCYAIVKKKVFRLLKVRFKHLDFFFKDTERPPLILQSIITSLL